MKILWRAFKVVLSAVLLAVMFLILYFFARHPDNFILLGLAGVFLFMTALLWANLKPTSREFALAGIVIALGILFVGLQTLTGATYFPRECSGRPMGRMLCDFENVLYAVGGPTLAAVPDIFLGVILLYGSARLVVLRSVSR